MDLFKEYFQYNIIIFFFHEISFFMRKININFSYSKKKEDHMFTIETTNTRLSHNNFLPDARPFPTAERYYRFGNIIFINSRIQQEL